MGRRLLLNLIFSGLFLSSLAAQSNSSSPPIAPPITLPAAPSAAPTQPSAAPTQPSAAPTQPSGVVPSLTPGALALLELEGRFSQAVATGGGKAFAAWFADDAVILNNGRPPVIGRAAIDAKTQWDSKTYQLTWTPQSAQMGPSNDMGFTWGHFKTVSKGKNGESAVTTGRYFTVWKKLPNGAWKVALDASAEEPVSTGNNMSPAP
jgi:ketosteroid isomerase-like protein